MKTIHHNQKVAKNRTDKWKSNLIKGRLEAMKSPTQLKIIRVGLGLSQKEVADQVGVTPATYGAIEVRKRLVKPDNAKKISKVLKAKETTLFKKKDEGKFLAI